MLDKKKLGNYILLFTYLSLVIGSIFLIPSNPSRGIVLSIIFLVMGIMSYTTRKPIITALLGFLVMLPYNITYQLEQLSNYYDPYVSNIKVNYLIPTLSMQDVMVGVLLLNILVYMFVKGHALTKKRVYILLGIVGYAVLHIVTHWELIVVFNMLRWLGYGLTVVLGYWLLVDVSVLKNVSLKVSKWFIGISVVNLLIQLGIGVLQMVRGTDLGLQMLGESSLINGMVGTSFVEIDGSVILRAYGTFPHPNVLAGFSLFSLVIISLFWKKAFPKCDSKVYMFLEILIFLIVGGIILLTFSRSALTVYVLAIGWRYVTILIGAYKSKRASKGRREVVKSTTLSAMVPYLQRFALQGRSLYERLHLLKAAWIIFLSAPLFGVGIGKFVSYMPGVTAITGQNGILLLQPVHNIYALLLVEHGGIFGGAMVIGLLYLLYMGVQKFLTGSLLVTIPLLMLVIVGGVDHYLVSLPQGMVIMCWYILFLQYFRLRNFYDK